jgi:hypothetical protein
MAQRYCTNCGNELDPEDRFCQNCGKPVHQAARVPTPEADVPVPPPPQQAETSPQSPQATEQMAAPTPVPQERLQWRWKWARGPIIFFLGSVIVTSLLDAAATQAAEGMVYVVAYAIGNSLGLLLNYVPIWLILGGLVYLIARLLGRKPSFFWVLFDWWVVVVVVTPILLGGFLGGFLSGLLFGA